jgi:hypothetical protein
MPPVVACQVSCGPVVVAPRGALPGSRSLRVEEKGQPVNKRPAVSQGKACLRKKVPVIGWLVGDFGAAKISARRDCCCCSS